LLRAEAFDITPGNYVVTFRWESAQEVFSETVNVHIDLANR
jgi:hypothetical protein